MNHSEKAASHAKRVLKGQKRTELLRDALIAKAQNLLNQSKNNEAKVIYEECYNFLVEAYYPDHPMVLEAANSLITLLIATNEYYDAERYARISYECLTRPIDTECLEIGNAAESLARVSYELIVQNGPESGDIVETEMLARKAIRIRGRILGRNHPDLTRIFLTLSNILKMKGNCYKERRGLLEQALSIEIKQEGVDSKNAHSANFILGQFHLDLSTEIPPGDMSSA